MGLRISPTTLHRARRANRKRRVKARRETRARVSMRLSRPATITATVEIARKGVRRGSQCRPKPRKPKKSDVRCTRYVTQAGKRTLKLNSGSQRFTLSPTFQRRQLALGSYRLLLVALDSGANRIGPVRRAFRVVR